MSQNVYIDENAHCHIVVNLYYGVPRCTPQIRSKLKIYLPNLSTLVAICFIYLIYMFYQYKFPAELN